MGRRCPSRDRAFTLVELLVVIGIIAVLIGLLFPVLRKARRTAVVLASPVAYVGSENRVHLTDPFGGHDTRLLPVATANCPVCHAPPSWSPSGQWIAMQQQDASNNNYTVLLDPMAQIPTRFQTHRSRTFMSGTRGPPRALRDFPVPFLPSSGCGTCGAQLSIR